MKAVFGAVGAIYDKQFGGPVLSYPAKLAAFGIMQYQGARTEFMNPKAFKESKFFDGGMYKRVHFASDDFGNYSYGVAAKAMGILLIDATQGAGIYGILKGSTKSYSNVFNFFDDNKDTEMIKNGYYGK